ncbi:MAG: hypothetical protein ACLSE4_05430 [Clostridium sp.]
MKKSWRRNVKCMVFAAGLALTLSCTAYADETTFVPGTSVNGLGISNMTVDQATQRIADFYASDYKLTIKEKGGKTEVITGPEIGYSVGLPEGYLQQILDQQNSSGRLSGPDVDNKHRSDMTGSFDSAALDAKIGSLNAISGSSIVTTEDAYVSGYQEGQPFTIVPEVRGNNADREKTAQLIREAASKGETEVDLEAAGCYYTPSVTKDDENLKTLCDTMNRCRGDDGHLYIWRAERGPGFRNHLFLDHRQRRGADSAEYGSGECLRTGFGCEIQYSGNCPRPFIQPPAGMSA